MSSSSRLYLDAVGGQPWSEAAISAFEIARNAGFSNPNATHSEAAAARQLREAALSTLGRMWQCPAITPVLGMGSAFRLALSAISAGQSVSANPLNRRGLLDLVSSYFPELLSVADTGLVDHSTSADVIVTQAGNQEIGTVSNLRHGNRALVIADATEHVGRMSHLPEADIVIARSSAWGGPSDVCFIIDHTSSLKIPTRMRVSLAPDTASLVASVAALEAVDHSHNIRQFQLIDTLRSMLPTGVEAVGDAVDRLPHIVSLIVHQIDGEALSQELDKRGIAVGSASACIVEEKAPSHVLSALGKPHNNHIRISLPLGVNSLDGFVEKLNESIAALQ